MIRWQICFPGCAIEAQRLGLDRALSAESPEDVEEHRRRHRRRILKRQLEQFKCERPTHRFMPPETSV